MGRSWSIDQLTRKSSMAQIVTIAESTLDENILFVGSGDGLIHFTTDGGANWQRSSVPGLPEYARVHHIITSHFDKLVAYVACHNYVGGDRNPYLYKTIDGGNNWFLINNLPKKDAHTQLQKIKLIKISFLWELSSEFNLQTMVATNGFHLKTVCRLLL